MKKYIAFTLALLLTISSFSYAIPGIQKNETVYVNMDYYGGINQINISNDITLFGQKEINDYAEYENITYFTDATYDKENSKFKSNDDKRLAYSGKVNNDIAINLPWTFDISYKLNGVSTVAESLLNANGLVEMVIDIKPNEAANEYYKNNYMLEITSSFDMNDYLSVESKDAIEVSTGKTKTLMFVVLPGQTKTITISMGSNDFEMDGLTFAMLPLTGEILDKIYEVVEDKEDFEDAIESLNNSTDVVLYAMNNMTGSILEMQNGMELLKEGNNNLHNTANDRNENIDNLSNEIEKLVNLVDTSKKDISNIQEQVEDINDLMTELDKHLKNLIIDVDYLSSDLSEMEEVIENLPYDLKILQDTLRISRSLIDDLQGLIKAQSNTSDIDSETIKSSMTKIEEEIVKVSTEVMKMEDGEEKLTLLGAISDMKTELQKLAGELAEIEKISNGAQTSTENLNKNLTALGKKISNISRRLTDIIDDDSEVIIETFKTGESLVKDLGKSLKTLKEYNEKFIEKKENIPNALENVTDLLNEAQEFGKSTILVIDSLEKTLNILDNELYEGTIKVTDGLIGASNELGIITNESLNFKNAKDSAKDIINNKWDEIEEKTTIFNVDPNAKPISFSSSENESPNKVQIMLKTPEIRQGTESVEDLETKNNEGTIWDRIVAIFVKIFENIKKLFSF